jgi:threonine/homoserine/homoserine lactone efflux protein
MILGGIGVVANIGQVLTGVTTQSGLVLVPIGIVGVTVWMIYLGVVMWRRSIGSRAADDGVRPALQAERQTS